MGFQYMLNYFLFFELNPRNLSKIINLIGVNHIEII